MSASKSARSAPGAGVDRAPAASGWYVNLLGERIFEFPIIQRTSTHTRANSDERGPENEEITFSDNNALPMTADVQVVMRIDPSKAPALYTRYRPHASINCLKGLLRNDVRSAVRGGDRTRQRRISLQGRTPGGDPDRRCSAWRANGIRKA